MVALVIAAGLGCRDRQEPHSASTRDAGASPSADTTPAVHDAAVDESNAGSDDHPRDAGDASDVTDACTVAKVCDRIASSCDLFDPRANEDYVCTREPPPAPVVDGVWTLLHVAEGCGRLSLTRSTPSPPSYSLTWDADTGEVVGAAFIDDVAPANGQCVRAGELFSCEESQQWYCLWQFISVYTGSRWELRPLVPDAGDADGGL